MKRLVMRLLTVLLIAPAAHAELDIVTTLPDFADLARQIGGDLVTTHSVMKGPESVHNVLATPPEMVALSRADLFVHMGLDAEPWRDNLVRGSRNSRIAPGKPGNVDLSLGVVLKDVPERVDRSQGDVHAYGNPHYTLDPAHMQRATATLARAMATADPANAAVYVDNARRYIIELGELAKEVRQTLDPYAGMKVVTGHDAWAYFADTVPISLAGTIEPKPGITPSPGQVRDLVERMRREDVRIIIVETFSDRDLAARVATDAGARLVVLPTAVNGTPEAATYVQLLRFNARSLARAAEAEGLPRQENGVRGD